MCSAILDGFDLVHPLGMLKVPHTQNKCNYIHLELFLLLILNEIRQAGYPLQRVRMTQKQVLFIFIHFTSLSDYLTLNYHNETLTNEKVIQK